MRPYVIVAPGYRYSSHGLRLLHYLCHLMNKMGIPAYVALFETTATNPEWQTPVATHEVLREAIVIYPEIISENPLQATRVVRWLLNRPGLLGRPRPNYGPDDYVVAYSRAVDATKPIFHLVCIRHELFNPHFLPPKTLELYYVGKGAASVRIPALELFKTEITASWPGQPHQLADLLRRARVLFSYDTLTCLTYEATLCGTLVVLIPGPPYSRADVDQSEAGMNGIAWGAETREIERALATLPNAYPHYLTLIAKQEEAIRAFVKATQERWPGSSDSAGPS